MTIDSDTEDAVVPQKSSKPEAEGPQLDAGFTFDLTGDSYADMLSQAAEFQDVVKEGSKPVCAFDALSRRGVLMQTQAPISVDDIIARRKLKRKREAAADSDDEAHSEEDEDDEVDSSECLRVNIFEREKREDFEDDFDFLDEDAERAGVGAMPAAWRPYWS